VKIIDVVRRRVAGLLASPVDELGSWARLLQTQIHLWRFCARRLRANNALAMSSALSFRTIFAMVPILILAFLTLKSLGVIEDKKQLLGDFLQESGLAQIAYDEPAESQPASAQARQAEGPRQVTLAEKIESVMTRVEAQLTVGRLGPIGVVLLVWTAVTLLTTMEQSLNRIFEAPKARPLGRRILLYWSAVTLGPLVLVVARYGAGRVVAVARGWPFFGWAIAAAGWAGPIIVGVVLLAMLYKLMPNTRVRTKAALEAAAVAVPVWLVVRWAFALYVDQVGRQSVYGAIGLVPLFLLWLNLSWYVFLFGAELAHTAANLARMQAAELSRRFLLGPWDMLAAVVALARPGGSARGPVPLERVSADLNISEQLAEELMRRLTDGGLVCRVAGEDRRAYLLTRPPDGLKVAEIVRLGSAFADGRSARNCAPAVTRAVELARSRAEAGIEGMTVNDIIADPQT